MNFPTNNPPPAATASPVRHELDLVDIKATSHDDLCALQATLLTLGEVAHMGVSELAFLNEGQHRAGGGILLGIAEHLHEIRQAVVSALEERQPAGNDDAELRARVLLVQAIEADAEPARLEELFHSFARERERNL